MLNVYVGQLLRDDKQRDWRVSKVFMGNFKQRKFDKNGKETEQPKYWCVELVGCPPNHLKRVRAMSRIEVSLKANKWEELFTVEDIQSIGDAV